MENNNDLRNSWSNVDDLLRHKSHEELRIMLEEKTKKNTLRFYLSTVASIILCIGVLTFLTVGIIKYSHDTYYVLNNIATGVIILFYLRYYLIIFDQLFSFKSEQRSLNENIRLNISILSGINKSKMEYILIPFLIVFLLLSVHRFYSSQNLLLLLQNEESLWGLLFGFLIGTGVKYYIFKKTGAFVKKQLEILQLYKSHL